MLLFVSVALIILIPTIILHYSQHFQLSCTLNNRKRKALELLRTSSPGPSPNPSPQISSTKLPQTSTRLRSSSSALIQSTKVHHFDIYNQQSTIYNNDFLWNQIQIYMNMSTVLLRWINRVPADNVFFAVIAWSIPLMIKTLISFQSHSYVIWYLHYLYV